MDRGQFPVWRIARIMLDATWNEVGLFLLWEMVMFIAHDEECLLCCLFFAFVIKRISFRLRERG